MGGFDGFWRIPSCWDGKLYEGSADFGRNEVMSHIVRFVLPAVALATVVSANLAATPIHVSAIPTAYYCEYPKSVTVWGHTVTTPTICVPSP